MDLSEQKKITIDALQSVSNLISIFEKSTLKLDNIKDSILIQLKEIESTLTKNKELISSGVENYKLETANDCIHPNVDHVITDDDHYYECVNCGAMFFSPPEDTVVRKTILRY